MPSFLAELAILTAAALSPLLPAPWPAPVLLALFALWLRRARPPRREVWVAGTAIVVAILALGAEAVLHLSQPRSEAQWSAAASREYQQLWQGLWQETGTAVRALGHPPQNDEETLTAFRQLAQFEVRAGGGRHGLLLLDPDGNAVAWAGEGLLHELKPEAVPRSGPHFVAGWSAITLLAVQPLDDQARRPWRVVAGASFPAQQLPFGSLSRLPLIASLMPQAIPARWSLVNDPLEAAPGSLVASAPDLPALVVARRAGRVPGDPGLPGLPGLPMPERPQWPRQVAWGMLGFALLALTVMRGVGVALPAGSAGLGGSAGIERRSRARSLVPLALGGLLAWGAVPAVPAEKLAGLVGGLAVAALGLAWRRRLRRARGIGAAAAGLPRAAGLLGAAAVLALVAVAWGLQRAAGPFDLSAPLLAEVPVVCLRIALAAAAFGLLAGVGAAGPGGPRSAPAAGDWDPETDRTDRWAWLAVLLLLAGGMLADIAPLALTFLAAGGAAAGRWSSRRDLGRLGMPLGALALIAVFAASGAAEVAYRLRLQSFAAHELLRRFAPPAETEVTALARDLAAHFRSRDLKNLVPRSPEGLERQDLAFALWRTSPLARRHTLSALVVEPFAGPPSSFSFGMPIAAAGGEGGGATVATVAAPATLATVDERQLEHSALRLPGWKGALLHGEAVLHYAGVPWARARYWLLPRPGFEVADRRDLGEVEVGLLKGGPAASPLDALGTPALYALYDPAGRAILSPWEEAPPLAPELRPGSAARWVATPSGPARAYSRRGPGSAEGTGIPEAVEAVYLPFEGPLEALERIATPALSVLLLAALGMAAALLLALPRAAFRDVLRRTVRSYSKRLLLVYTALLLVPLLLLNAVLVRAMGERLEREQRKAGEAALDSAQHDLGDRFLNLPEGFGVDTALTDTLLNSLSQVVRHEVNVYWRSTVTASSKHELFTAGLLPKRIPGEIYSRLALLGFDLSSRTNHAGGTDYLELYAPLRVPGVSQGEERLFLSIPLLAQQEEAAAELGHLRRRAFLVTAALFVVSIAVGTRLARNFTRPLAQLVEGTRRIAAGAPALDLAPSELELAALVAAVDDMAHRIAQGRERLMREKQVVERVVENITSGVVSVDGERRVLMHNRVAAELLGVATGQSLERAVGHDKHLAPVAAFLRAAGDSEMSRSTVRLPGGDDLGESREREWTLVWVPLPGSGEPAALLVVEDATEELRGQRLFAWAEMARIIAHEIKNPLTPIRLSTEHMQEVYRHDREHFDRVFERCTGNILTQVEELRSIAGEFSTYSEIARIDLKPGDLTAVIAALVEGYRAAPPEGVEVDLEIAPADGEIAARFDAKLLGRAVRNLLENALRASAGGGRVVVRVERLADGATARVTVADHGPGVKPELLGRIFDPYFSTHDTGTGLGLPIARRIAEEHGGAITARNRAEGGLEVAITLPIQ